MPSYPAGLWLFPVWGLFAWAAVSTLAIGLLLRDAPRPHRPGETLLRGWWLSLNAGTFEELIYRWLAFFIAMMILPVLDLITFGAWGWVYREALIPVANWATFGALAPQLLGHPDWVFGAAVVSASMGFRNAHKHLGFLGWVNSWFIGMVFFWLMFNHGLETAIAAHVLYDGVAFSALALTFTWRPDPSYYYLY